MSEPDTSAVAVKRLAADILDSQPRSPNSYLVAAALCALAAERDALAARLAAANAERDEARRRRDEWRKKAEGYDAVRLALREKVGAPWPPHMSRLLWAGIAADEKKRREEAEAEVARLREALAQKGGG